MPGRRKRKATSAPVVEDEMVELHRSEFVDWRPTPVISLAASRDGSLAAALREDGDIELYDATTFTCIQRIPGSTTTTPTCLAVVDEEYDSQHRSLQPRIFTGGLEGVISEHSLESLTPAGTTDSYGGAVWRLVPEPGGPVAAGTPRRLAAACDDGAVRLFRVDPGQAGLALVRALPRVDGRTLCLAWHPNGDVLASGGTDNCIHLWSTSTGRELQRINAGDGSSGGGGGKTQCVWDVLVLPDGTLVSADSAGNVTFWDGRFGTQLARFKQHSSAVLRLAASPDGATVFAAGVDSQVAVFRRQKGRGGGGGAGGGKPVSNGTAAGDLTLPRPVAPWVFLSAKRPHTHDVRAMCVVAGKHCPSPRLLTAGNDTKVLNHSVPHFLREHPICVDPCPQRPLLQAARVPGSVGEPVGGGRVPWLLAAQRDRIDVWQLGTSVPGQQGTAEGAPVHTAVGPQQLARLLNKGSRYVLAAALSPDGTYLAYSDVAALRCVRLAEQPGDDGIPVPHLGLTPVPLPTAVAEPARLLAFRPGTTQLIACGLDGTIKLIDVAAVEAGPLPAAAVEAAAAEAAAAEAAAAEAGRGKKAARRGKKGKGAGGSGSSGGSSSGGGVVVLRALRELRYKPHTKRDRGRSAARWALPAAELMAVSPDGRWLAVVVHQRIHLISLQGHSRVVGQLPPVVADAQLPITALAFLPGSKVLVAATSALHGPASQHQLAAYDVEKQQHTEWSLRAGSGPGAGQNGVQQRLPARLRGLPGIVVQAAARPGAAASTSAVLQTAHALCQLDVARPLAREAVGLGAGLGRGKRRRLLQKPAPTNTPAGENSRVVHGEKVLLHAQFIGPRSLLLVEHTWEEAWKEIAPPVYRHRFGT